MDLEEVYRDIRMAVEAVAKLHGIEVRNINFRMLISQVHVRNAVIRQEYEDTKPAPGESERVREALAGKYGLATKSLDNILYKE